MSDGIGLGAYRLQERLGTGGMGAVYRAVHARTRQPVAIKLVTRGGDLDDAHVSALRHEVAAVARLDHPRIARVLDMGEVEGSAIPLLRAVPGSPFVVYELLEGGALIGRRPMRWSAVRRVLESLLEALAHAHANGLVHRDVKPQNVLLPTHGPVWELKLTDFGIAWALRGQRTLGGTPGYMPPEQIAGQWELQGPHTDLYAVGRVALFALTGTPAGLQGPGPLVPAGFEGWLDGLLAPDPSDRWSMAADALAALRSLGPEDEALRPREGELQTGSETITLGTFDSPEFELPPARIGASQLARPGWTDAWERPRSAPRDELDGVARDLFRLRRIPLIGREGAQQALWTALEGAFRGEGPAVRVLVGPEGSGRSRLARWLGERAYELGIAHSVGGRGSARGGALAHSVRRWLRIDETVPDWPDRIARSVALRTEDPVLQRIWSALARGEGSGAALIQEWADWLARVGDGRPVVVALDDLGPGADPLAIAAEIRSTARVVLVLCGESEAPWIQAIPEPERIALPPLELGPSLELVRRILPIEPRLCGRIAALGAGCPGRLHGLIGDLVARERLAPGRAGLRLVGGERLAPVEGEARLERLLEGATEDSVRALELAVTGPLELELPLWRAACGRAGLDPDEALLEPWFTAGVLEREQAGGAWRWADHAVRERLAARAEPRRVAHHRVWAQVLDEPGAVGRHLLRAGDWEPAVDALLEGAGRAQSQDRFERAAALLQDFEDAAERAAMPAGDPRRGDALFLSVRLALSRGRLELASELASTLERTAAERGWEVQEARAWWLLGRLALFRGEHDRAGELLGRALGWGRVRDDPMLIARGLFDLGQLDLQMRRGDQARRRFKEAREAYRAAGFSPGEAVAASFEVHAALQQGDLEGARAAAEVAGAALRAAGALRAESEHALMLGQIAVAESDLPRAVQCFEQAVRTGRRNTAAHAASVVNLAMALDALDRPSEVWSALEPEMDTLTRMGRWRMLAAAWAVALSAAAALGDEAQLDAALSGYRAQNAGRGQPPVPEVSAVLERAVGRAERRGWLGRAARIRLLLE